jgi:hypothetical protein
MEEKDVIPWMERNNLQLKLNSKFSLQMNQLRLKEGKVSPLFERFSDSFAKHPPESTLIDQSPYIIDLIESSGTYIHDCWTKVVENLDTRLRPVMDTMNSKQNALEFENDR